MPGLSSFGKNELAARMVGIVKKEAEYGRQCQAVLRRIWEIRTAWCRGLPDDEALNLIVGELNEAEGLIWPDA